LNEPQPILGYLLSVFVIALGAAIILSARKIVEFNQRANRHTLTRIER
jgi:hypothetical protein